MNRKTIVVIFIGIFIVLIISSLIEKAWNAKQQHADFHENVGVSLSDEETVFIEKFYSDLNVIYEDVKLLDQTETFNSIPPMKEGDSRNVRKMTYELLKAVCDSNYIHDQERKFSDINSSMGTFSFRKYILTRKWDRAFWSDLQYLYSEKYFAIVTYISVELPELEKNADYFTTGLIFSSLAIYDLSSLKCVAHDQISAENSDDIQFKKYTSFEAKSKKLKKDLVNQYNKAIDNKIKELLDLE